MIAMSMLLLSGALVAEVPDVVTVSAYLEEGGTPVDGVVAARFTFFDAAEGGAAVWSELLPALVVDGGVFVAELGGRADNPMSPEVFAGPRWLEVIVNDVVLAPRARAASVPYALAAARAAVCESLDGTTSDDIAELHLAVHEPVTRPRIAGNETPVFLLAASCAPDATRVLTLSSTCSTPRCKTSDGGIAFLRCDGSCGASTTQSCDNSSAGWLLAP